MRLMISCAAALVFLAGCDTRPVEQLGYAERQKLANEITARCAKMGIDPRSPQMEACQRAEVEAEFSKRAAWRASNAVAAGAMQSYSSSQQSYLDQSGPVRCTSSRLGSSINTTCY